MRKRQPGVRRLPSGRWQARPTIDGIQVSLGTHATSKEANAAIEQARVDARKGAFVSPTAGRITLTDWSTLWLDGRVSIASGTRNSYAVTIRAFGWLGDVELTDLSPTHIRKRIAEWTSAGLAPTTVKVRLTHMKAILGAAVDEQRLVRNPASHSSVETPKGGPRKARRYLTFAEVEAVTAVLPELYADLVWTMAWSGFRVHEALGLTGEQVDVDAGRFRLRWQWSPDEQRHVRLKGRQEEDAIRHTPIAADLQPIVVRRMGLGLLFPSPQRPGSPPAAETFADQLDRACLRSGVERFTGHDLRSTCASWLHATGASIVEAAEWLGHRDATITARVYTSLWPAQLDRTADRMANIKAMDMGAGVTRLRRAE